MEILQINMKNKLHLSQSIESHPESKILKIWFETIITRSDYIISF